MTELIEYIKENRKLLDEAPNVMYAVAKIDESVQDTIKPGVIFTLTQVKGNH